MFFEIMSMVKMSIKNFFNEIKNILKWRLRNLFIDPLYILRWDLFPKMKKNQYCQINDEIISDIRIPVTFITYKRPWYFEKTIKSFIEMNQSFLDRLVLIVLVQDKDDKATKEIISNYKNQIDNVIYSKINLGCAGGYNLLMTEAIKLMLPYIVHIQDDFVSYEPLSNYIFNIIKVMEKNDSLGCIRLRSIKDKVNDYNVISRRKIRYEQKIKGIGIGNWHFTFNPTISKSFVIKELIPTSSENDAQKKYQDLGLKTGQLFAECFSHIGHERVKDWIK